MANTFRKLRDFTHDVQEHARHDNWRQMSRWLIRTLISLPYCHIEYTVFTRSLLEPLPVATPRLPVALRLATESDLVRFEGLIPASDLRHYRRRLAHGRYCYLALDGENLAAYCWASTQIQFDIDNLVIQLQPGDTYLDDAHTIPAYQRQGIQTVLHLFRLEHMKKLGYQRAVLIIQENNAASQQLVRKLGYQETDHLSFRRILWKRIYHYHSGRF